MKKILYLATTINGYIAKSDDSTEWSAEEWEEYKSRINHSGALIIGRRTYEIMKNDSDFLGMNCKVAVISHDKLEDDKTISFSSPHEAIKYFESLGIKDVYIAGGSKINELFLKENLIDEIVLDIEPILYGEGIPLISPEDIELNLSLIGTKILSNNTIQISYKVVK